MNIPLVSIIIPTFNRAHLIGETLDSVLAQTYENWECMVVDDGSTDNTEEIIGNYSKIDSRFQYHQRPKDLLSGGNAARNFGFELSKGEFVNWFDDDDLMLAEKIELQIIPLSKSIYDLSVCQTMVFQGRRDNTLGLRKEKIYSEDFFNDFVCNEIKWLTQSPIIRRSFLEKHQIKFDENIKQSQERDFFVKVLDKIDDYLTVDIPLVWLRKHPESITYSNISNEKCYSNFIVNYNILNSYNKKLNSISKLYVKRMLKNMLKKAIVENKPELFNLFKSIIFKDKTNFSKVEKVKLKIGIYSMCFLKKGEVFYK